MTEDARCTEIVDVIWRRKRYPSVQCVQNAEHINSPFPVTAQHHAYVPDRGVFWSDSSRAYNRKVRRFEVRG